jgi:hypothetical protein
VPERAPEELPTQTRCHVAYLLSVVVPTLASLHRLFK